MRIIFFRIQIMFPNTTFRVEYLVANNGFKYWNEIIPRHIYEMFNFFMIEVPII